MTQEPTAWPFVAPAAVLWPPSRIVLRLRTTLDGPTSEAHTIIERFDGLDFTHVSTLVPGHVPIARVRLDAIETFDLFLAEALRDISPF